MPSICGCCLPTFDISALGFPYESTAVVCMLKYSHGFYHLAKRPDGKYIAWTHWLDEPCGCDSDDCDCFDYSTFDTEEEAREFIDEKSPA